MVQALNGVIKPCNNLKLKFKVKTLPEFGSKPWHIHHSRSLLKFMNVADSEILAKSEAVNSTFFGNPDARPSVYLGYNDQICFINKPWHNDGADHSNPGTE